jgi:S-DNA-T family DNA segregation ATPase FtsK/SpoIIIE
MLKSSKKTNISWIAQQLVRLFRNKKFCVAFAAICSLFLWLTLISYSPTDSSCFYYATGGMVTNWCASLGAHVAAFLIYFFGMSSWLFAVWSSYLVYYLFCNLRCYGESRDKLLVLFIAPFMSAIACSWYRYEFYASTIPGGLFGALAQRFLVYSFDTFGAAIVLHIALIALFLICAPRVSWFVIRKITQLAFKVFSWATIRYVYEKIATGLSYIVRYIRAAVHFVMYAISGSSSVLGKQQSVITFERIDMSDVFDLEDPFWDVYFNRQQKDSELSNHAKKEEQVLSVIDSDIRLQEHIKNVVETNPAHTDSHFDAKIKPYVLPQPSLVAKPTASLQDRNREELQQRASILEQKLVRFGIQGKVTAIKEGPVVTLFEYEPSHDTKLSKIIALEDDLAMALQALSIRIIAPIPGRSVVGFEVANKKRSDVSFASIVHSVTFQEYKGSLPLILGHDTVGNTVIIDLAKMPHLLVAGSTGSGKSVALNAMLVSMLYKLTPDELKLILIDPKRLEFAPYADIPHLLFPIVTDPRKAAPVLSWVVRTMEERYEQMAQCGVRNIGDYNILKTSLNETTMPFIVVVIDELADLMMTAAREVEDLIARIAQMARAAGIHLLVATQRPSVDVITGLIKVNFPSRISFRVTSKIDSRTILDCSGAEKLLGRGDMLFLDGASASLKRAHGAYVSDKEIETIVAYTKAQRAVHYLDITQELVVIPSNGDDARDHIFDDVVAFVRQCDEVSISLLQRRFKIGFNRSARIIDQLEAQGIIMPSENGKTRKVIRS